MLTKEQIDAIRKHPSTSIEDPDTWYARIGWLLCVMDVLAELEKENNLLLLNEQV